jgi:hypothetical protein
MKRKGWMIFGVVAVFEAAFLQFPALLLLSVALLLPGSLFWAELSWGRTGTNLPLWMLGAISIRANVLLFGLASFAFKKIRRSQ